MKYHMENTTLSLTYLLGQIISTLLYIVLRLDLFGVLMLKSTYE